MKTARQMTRIRRRFSWVCFDGLQRHKISRQAATRNRRAGRKIKQWLRRKVVIK